MKLNRSKSFFKTIGPLLASSGGFFVQVGVELTRTPSRIRAFLEVQPEKPSEVPPPSIDRIPEEKRPQTS